MSACACLVIVLLPIAVFCESGVSTDCLPVITICQRTCALPVTSGISCATLMVGTAVPAIARIRIYNKQSLCHPAAILKISDFEYNKCHIRLTSYNIHCQFVIVQHLTYCHFLKYLNICNIYLYLYIQKNIISPFIVTIIHILLTVINQYPIILYLWSNKKLLFTYN